MSQCGYLLHVPLSLSHAILEDLFLILQLNYPGLFLLISSLELSRGIDDDSNLILYLAGLLSGLDEKCSLAGDVLRQLDLGGILV